MSKTITVTLNPSLDRTLITHYFNPGYPNRTTEPTRLDPAGRGVNISRALSRLDQATNAVVLLGSDATSYSYKALLARETMPFTVITRTGRTRSNITIIDTGNQQETQVIEEATVGNDQDIQAITETLTQLAEPDDIVVFAGNLTVDGPRDTYRRLIEMLRSHGVSVMMVTFGEPLKLALSAKPERIAITRAELEALVNYPIRSVDDARFAARALTERGIHEILIAQIQSPETPDALLITPQESYYAIAPQTTQRGSSSGVVDALIAGVITAIKRDESALETLRFGVACATFTAAQIGNEFGAGSEVQSLLHAVKVESMGAQTAGA
ncbi:MAG: PfkB family carbohydrate kinase [Anaerolineae bacterium]|jgi:1-phosphofructokinase family hexose kinase|nr:PfkB family carbohydrate kinase [Anaerolineae bacterium]